MGLWKKEKDGQLVLEVDSGRFTLSERIIGGWRLQFPDLNCKLIEENQNVSLEDLATIAVLAWMNGVQKQLAADRKKLSKVVSFDVETSDNPITIKLSGEFEKFGVDKFSKNPERPPNFDLGTVREIVDTKIECQKCKRTLDEKKPHPLYPEERSWLFLEKL